jgi:hypothetical protein
MMLKIIVPVEVGTDAIKNGAMLPALQQAFDQLKPEAAYFFPEDGQRCALFFLDVQDSSDMAPTLEPFWMNLQADVSLVPVMNFDDLKAGLSKLAL